MPPVHMHPAHEVSLPCCTQVIVSLPTGECIATCFAQSLKPFSSISVSVFGAIPRLPSWLIGCSAPKPAEYSSRGQGQQVGMHWGGQDCDQQGPRHTSICLRFDCH